MACALSASTVSSAAAPLQSLSFPRAFAGAAARPLRLARSARTRNFVARAGGRPAAGGEQGAGLRVGGRVRPGVHQEITAFSDRYEEFEKINTEILGASIDSVFSHLAWVRTDGKSGGLGDLKYPLISDVTKSISKSFSGIALRGLFIIDKEGVIQHSTINNLAIGRSVDETFRTLQALQYVQENPDEVCLAGWKPGEKLMKPDPKGSKEYFAAI